MWSGADPARLVVEMGAGGAVTRATSRWPRWGAGSDPLPSSLIGGAVRRRLDRAVVP